MRRSRGNEPAYQEKVLAIQRGEFVGVLGPNGAGESSLLMALGGILPIRYGRIEIEGNDLQRLRIKERGRLMAFVIQDAEVRLRFLCGEVVRLGR
ncbi:MAG: ABC transporter ATP-binding protein [Syntrophobacteraceae bacterium]|nr:ABC transporter ATP-binding protein [Syntrophobacteraceae bacterium]